MAPSRPILVSTLHDLIAAPLTAVIEADFMAAREFARYVGEFGFEEPPASPATGSSEQPPRGFLGDLRTVSFRFDQTDADGRVRPRIVRLPTLSLIPLPLLKVKEADFRFAVRVLAGVSEEEPAPVRLLDAGKEEDSSEPDRMSWRAMFAPEAGRGEGDGRPIRDGVDANMDVRLSVSHADIPVGIARLCALMNESTQILSGSIHLSRRRLELPVGEPATVEITVYGLTGSPAPCKLRAVFPESSGLRLEANGAVWKPGGEVSIRADGSLSVRVLLDTSSQMRPGDAIPVCFEATVDGIPLSEALTVYVREPHSDGVQRGE